VRRYSSTDQPLPIGDIGNIPAYWMRPTQILSGAAGFHRFIWDEHFGPPAGTTTFSYPMSATPFNTAPTPLGPWVLPGKYTAKLTVNGKAYTETFRVKLDPRIKTPAPALRQQYLLSLAMYDGLATASAAEAQVRTARSALATLSASGDAPSRAHADSLDRELVALSGATGGGRGVGRGGNARTRAPTLGAVTGELTNVLGLLQDSDMAPTITMVDAAHQAAADLSSLQRRWQALQARLPGPRRVFPGRT
jgi:hypothetical protein